jgi:succinate dehydrogenase flavin-adding protein (antitoxin of CptAB toxin-antitoxin module)
MPESLDIRRKRLLFRSRQRGMLETSLLLRAFAERHLDALDEDALDRFEVLLEANDNDLLDWVVGKKAPPAAVAPHLLDMIKNIRKHE